MDINLLDPQMQPIYARLPKTRFGNPLVRWYLQFKQNRSNTSIPAIPGVNIWDYSLGHCSLRFYRPETVRSKACILWAHGGGYVYGSVAFTDFQCIHLAKALGVLVVSVDYRLAPKYPFPAAHDDCYSAWQYLQNNAQALAVDPTKIALVGQSAGGGLMAGLAQRLLDETGVQPVAQVLIYPMLDDRTGANTAFDKLDHFLWNNSANRAAWQWYLKSDLDLPEQKDYAVPARRQALQGLPPVWLGIGELDLFYEENIQYSNKLRDCDVHVQLITIPGAPHGFDVIAYKSEASHRWVNSYTSYLQEKLCSNEYD